MSQLERIYIQNDETPHDEKYTIWLYMYLMYPYAYESGIAHITVEGRDKDGRYCAIRMPETVLKKRTNSEGTWFVACNKEYSRSKQIGVSLNFESDDEIQRISTINCSFVMSYTNNFNQRISQVIHTTIHVSFAGGKKEYAISKKIMAIPGMDNWRALKKLSELSVSYQNTIHAEATLDNNRWAISLQAIKNEDNFTKTELVSGINKIVDNIHEVAYKDVSKMYISFFYNHDLEFIC